jgi:hypothetical protein
MCVNRRQDFVIDRYTLCPRSFDALIFGCYDGGQRIYVARTRNGFPGVAEGPVYQLPHPRDAVLGTARGFRTSTERAGEIG